MTPHLNRLVETVQMKGHNICFYAELTIIIPNYHQILPLIWSSEVLITVCTKIILEPKSALLHHSNSREKFNYVCMEDQPSVFVILSSFPSHRANF